MKKIFGPDREKVTGHWGKKLHIEKLNNFCCSRNIYSVESKKNDMGSACDVYDENIKAYRILLEEM